MNAVEFITRAHILETKVPDLSTASQLHRLHADVLTAMTEAGKDLVSARSQRDSAKLNCKTLEKRILFLEQQLAFPDPERQT